jgi:hypothetical protein
MSKNILIKPLRLQKFFTALKEDPKKNRAEVFQKFESVWGKEMADHFLWKYDSAEDLIWAFDSDNLKLFIEKF